jgi:hypothetical protein
MAPPRLGPGPTGVNGELTCWVLDALHVPAGSIVDVHKIGQLDPTREHHHDEVNLSLRL